MRGYVDYDIRRQKRVFSKIVISNIGFSPAYKWKLMMLNRFHHMIEYRAICNTYALLLRSRTVP